MTKVKMPNPKAAIDYQESLLKAADRQLDAANCKMENLNTPGYNVATQSCLTHVFDVLREAGANDAPTHSNSKDKFTKRFMVNVKGKSREDFPDE